VTIVQEVFSLPVDGADCFCIYRAPADHVTGIVLHLPAFADEMNKSRAMTARAARALAACGFGVLQIDLLGCGDSGGEHKDATYAAWTDNLLRAVDWLRRRNGPSVGLWLWGLRAGALLAPNIVARFPTASLLLWQPMLSGTQLLNHLLRQKSAADMLGPGGDRTSTSALRERLLAGEALEVGGYAISPALASDLAEQTFALPESFRGMIAWFEVGPGASGAPPPAARGRIEALRSAGLSVDVRTIQGPGFWQSVEIERCEALIESSVDAMETMRTHGLSRDTVIL